MALVTISNPSPVSAFIGQVVSATGTELAIQALDGSVTQTFYGTGFTYSGASVTGGTVNRVVLSSGATTYYDITGLSHSAVTVAGFVTNGDGDGLSAFLLAGNDTIHYFSSVSAAIFGYAGNDSITAQGGDDTLDGGQGNDTLRGGAGNDTYLVDSSGDVADETGGSGTDTLISSVSQVLGTGIDHLELSGFADLSGTGNSLQNRLVGNSGANALSGEGGNDTLDGGFGADQMAGGTGNDSYYVDNLLDTVAEQAGSGQDTVLASLSWQLGNELEALVLSGTGAINGTGNALDNTISGNDADNLLDGGTGADTLVGNGGNDTFVVDNAGDVLQDSSGTDTVRSSLAATTLATGFEHLELTGGAVSGTGNTGANRITGTSGNNTLTGGGGDDTLDGGAGTDVLTGGSGNDSYHIDTLQDSISDSGGVDRVYSAASGYVLGNGLEHLTLTGAALVGTGNTLANQITGNSGNNLLDGGDGDDTLAGGDGDDTYVANDAGDVLQETSGNDTVRTSRNGFTLAADFENLVLTGSAINGTGNSVDNALTGNSANNSLTGAGGNDTLDGGAGQDTLVGGSGNDTYVVDALLDVVIDTGGYDILVSQVNDYLFASQFDELRLAGSATLATGNAGNNLILGTAAGNRIDGGAGADTMLGGQGDDIYIVDQDGDAAQEQAGEGSDEIRSSVNVILPAEIEHLTLTGQDGIHGTGNTADNRITGNSAGNILDGSLGADTLEGLGGNDVYWVDNAGDVVIETAGGGDNDTVRTVGVSFSLAATDVESMQMESSLVPANSFSGTGNALDNTIIASSTGQVTLIGGGGHDNLQIAVLLDGSVLLGEAGNDQLQGSARADSLDGGTDSDTLHGGEGNDTLQGGSGNDTLSGDGGDDQIDGGGNDDLLLMQHSYAFADARFGRATVTGGNGADQFHYRTLPGQFLQNFTMPGAGFSSVAASDRITDFQPAQGDVLVTGITNGQGGEFNTRAVVWYGAADSAFQALPGQSLALAGDDAGNLRFLGFWTVFDSLNNRTVLYMDTDRDGLVSGPDLRIDFDGAPSLGPDSFSAGTFVVQTGTSGADTNTRIPIGALADYAFGMGGNDTLDGLDGNDSVSGDRGDDVLAGSAGDDRVFGGAGQDSINGGADNDSLYGGTGNDTLLGGEGQDELWADGYQDGTTYQQLYVSDAADSSNQLFGGGGHDFLLGSPGTDTLQGEQGDDSLFAGDGDDILDGGDGHDSMQGGGGRDTLTGGDGNDTLVVGEEGNARGSRPDLLDGGIGDDQLVFNPFGAGVASGGTGADQFNFFGSFSTAATLPFSPVSAPDRITDFNAAEGDRIGLGFSDGLSTGGGGPVVWRGAAAEDFTATVGQSVALAGTPIGIPYYLDLWMVPLPASGLTVVFLDRNNDGLVDDNDLRIELAGSIALNAASFASGSTSNAGTPQADTSTQLPGSAGADALYGLQGDDTLGGLAGDDRIFGNQGNDWLNGGADQDRLYGGSDNDLLQGLGGSDYLLGGTGNDTLEGGEGDDFLYAATVNNTDFDGVVDAPGSSNRMLGGGGNDLIVGDEGRDLLAGGPGEDTLMGQGGSDTAGYEDAAEPVTVDLNVAGTQFVSAGQGLDILINIENLLGSGFNDTLTGNAQANRLSGGGGNDSLNGGGGVDTLDGGSGFDVAHYGLAAAGVVAELWRSFTLDDGDGAQDSLQNLEGLIGSGHNDLLAGSDGNELFSGGSGSDGLYAAGGLDTLIGGAGNDTLDGGAGIDIAHYGAATGPVTAELWRSYALNDGQGGQDALWNIEGLTGSAFNDLLAGGAANDILIGSGGNDGLYAAAGNDTLVGGTGSDTVDGGPGIDIADYGGATAPVTAELWRSYALNDGQGGQDALWNIEGVLGSPFNDLLAGGANNEVLVGGAGSDGLYGAGGIDTLIGGAGNDTMDGGPGIDAVDYGAAAGPVTAELWRSFATNDGQGGQDALWNIEYLLGSGFNDLLAGTTGDNYLAGQNGADQLYAAGGNDTLVGGLGNDTLNGGAGLDVFLFNTTPGAANVDIVQDFAVVDDSIWLENAVFTALMASGPLAMGQLRAGAGVTTAADGDDFILYNSSTGALYYDADGNGMEGLPVQFAVLGIGLAATAADFVAV